MPLFENCSPYAAADTVGLDGSGAEYFLLVVKATFRWDETGRCELADEMQPVAQTDQPSGDGSSSVAIEHDFAPVKDRVDVVLAGRVALPAEVEQVEARLDVGDRIHKQVRISGDRYWLTSGATTLALSPPRPFSEMPIAWERSFGGVDPEDPGRFEARNPAGVGMAKHAKSLQETLAPNFEDPKALITSWKDRPRPVGFGPVGRGWQGRVQYAGTYDEAWRQQQAPLPPEDLQTLYYSCAPVDQQLDGYRPGETVRLENLTERGREIFALPEFEVEVLRQRRRSFKTEAERIVPDTIIIEPAERRFSLVGRYRHYPTPTLDQLGTILLGPSRGRERAQRRRKVYADFRAGEARYP